MNKNDVITQIGDESWNSAFAMFIAEPSKNPNTIFKWTLEYFRSELFITAMSVGIVSNTADDDYDTDLYCFSRPCKYNFYAWEAAWECTRTHSAQNEREYGESPDDGYHEIIMELNTKLKSLKFIHNNVDYGIAFDDIDMNLSYRLAASFADKGDKLKIVDFACINI